MGTISTPPGELREDVPLKEASKGSRGCFFKEDCLGGSRFVNVSFAVLTFVITFFLILQIYYGDYQVVPQGSVASDGKECSEIGTTILKNGGNAADATVATALCLAVVCPHIVSLDSRGQLLIYDHRGHQPAEVLDFQHVQTQSPYTTKLAISLMFLHRNYGTLPWKDLVDPAANLAKKGFLVSKMLERAITKERPPFFDANVVAGQFINLPSLSRTLEIISDASPDDVLGSMAESNWPLQSASLNFTFDGYNVYAPSKQGYVLASVLNRVQSLNFKAANVSTPEYLNEIANITKLEYDKFEIYDTIHVGTSSNIAAMDTNDLYVSFVSGLFQHFGSKHMTNEGYFLDVDAQNVTYSHLPVIVADKFVCGRRISTGSNDVATAAQVISTLLIAKQNITTSIESPRFNIYKDYIGIEEHEPLFTNEELQGLEKLEKNMQQISEPYFSCNVVEKYKDVLSSHSDSRGGGIASRF